MDETKYLFVAYSESDYEQIDNIFLELYKNGIAVKSAKDSHDTAIDSIICDASAVMFVISPDSLNSRTVQQHLQVAELNNKHIIPYFLCPPEEVQLPSSFYLKMDGSATIPAYEYADEGALVRRALSEIKPYFPEVFEPKKKKKSPIVPLACTLSICVIGLLAYFLWLQPMQQEKVLTHVRNSTVQIYNLDKDADSYNTGSGFFINNSGLIATNYHVIDNGAYILVQPSTEDEYYLADIVAYDAEIDLAIIQLEEEYTSTNYLTFSNKKVSVGDNIYVSGYPRGIDLTISNGIVSNGEHYVNDESAEYFLVTAAVSPGNSGGPVINTSGKVIGIATAKYETAENLNLIRPISYLKELIDEK